MRLEPSLFFLLTPISCLLESLRFEGLEQGTMKNLLTVDLEDWFHICEVEHLLPRQKWNRLPSTVVEDTENLLTLFAKTDSRATFFVLGYVAENHPELVRRIHHMGHEIGYHGWEHELVYELSPQEFRRGLRKGIEGIERLVDKKPIGFRAPQWSINERSSWALEILSEEGFVYDSSMAPLKIIGDESYPRTPWKIKTSSGENCFVIRNFRTRAVRAARQTTAPMTKHSARVFQPERSATSLVRKKPSPWRCGPCCQVNSSHAPLSANNASRKSH